MRITVSMIWRGDHADKNMAAALPSRASEGMKRVEAGDRTVDDAAGAEDVAAAVVAGTLALLEPILCEAVAVTTTVDGPAAESVDDDGAEEEDEDEDEVVEGRSVVASDARGTVTMEAIDDVDTDAVGAEACPVGATMDAKPTAGAPFVE